MTNELNGTIRAESTFRLGHFAQRTLYLRSSKTILYKDTYAVVTGNIQVLYNLDNLIHEEHALN